jgi:hypothetical protein
MADSKLKTDIAQVKADAIQEVATDVAQVVTPIQAFIAELETKASEFGSCAEGEIKFITNKYKSLL